MTDAPVRAKLAKIIPRLGTDHAGEVVATVEAMKRTLAAGGLDLHDLAAWIGDAGADVDPVLEDIEFALSHCAALNAIEIDFLTNVRRWVRYGGELSVKQRAWLGRIAARFEGE